tara:strand:+ start:396 stop:1100 length:705 start_codon:yes stop_codon:yes gene_type:complete
MIAYSPSRRLDQIVDSQGDGSGTVNQAQSAKTISGATNATPIVVTATSHGYSNGDFVNITGVAGNTACNDLHVIQSTTTNTFELTTPAGTDVAGNGSYSSGGAAHLSFACKPAAGETYCMDRFTGYFQDSISNDDKYMDETALSVGIKVQVRQDTTLVHTISPTPIKTAPVGWSLGGGPNAMVDKMPGSAYAFNWIFSSCFMNLNGDSNEFFVVLHSDSIAIEQQVMSVHGESI